MIVPKAVTVSSKVEPTLGLILLTPPEDSPLF